MIFWIQGPSGAGKTTVGRALASLVGIPFLDTDAEIEREHGPIAAIFADRGEETFRRLERELIERIVTASSSRTMRVVALGGGAVTDHGVRDLVRSSGIRIFLDVTPELALERLSDASDRPLLAGDPERRWRDLAAARRAAYLDADIRVDASGEPSAIADAIFEAVGPPGAPLWSTTAELAGEPSEVTFYRSVDALLERLRALTSGRRVCVVADTTVARLFERSIGTIARDGIVHLVEPGEGSKTLAEVERLAGRLVAAEFSRRDVIVGVGGGVVTDLAGFAASVFMRGVRAIYVPTTLLAQVDASVGGKTAVDAAGIRNLIGTFRQPTHVLISGAFLRTLPARELRSGFVEALKMGIANSPSLDREVRAAAPAILAGELPENIDSLLLECVRAKLEVVAGDVHDEGARMTLNFGHTFGHALEGTMPGRFSHGEAVAFGIVAAAELAVLLGLATPERAEEIIERTLPFTAPEPERPELLELLAAMSGDKKRSGDTLRFILPVADGVVIREADAAPALAAAARAFDRIASYHPQP